MDIMFKTSSLLLLILILNVQLCSSAPIPSKLVQSSGPGPEDLAPVTEDQLTVEKEPVQNKVIPVVTGEAASSPEESPAGEDTPDIAKEPEPSLLEDQISDDAAGSQESASQEAPQETSEEETGPEDAAQENEQLHDKDPAPEEDEDTEENAEKESAVVENTSPEQHDLEDLVPAAPIPFIPVRSSEDEASEETAAEEAAPDEPLLLVPDDTTDVEPAALPVTPAEEKSEMDEAGEGEPAPEEPAVIVLVEHAEQDQKEQEGTVIYPETKEEPAKGEEVVPVALQENTEVDSALNDEESFVPVETKNEGEEEPEESSPEEPTVEETSPQESSPEEPVVEGTTPQESSPEEPTAEGTSPQESSPEEPAVEETTPQESSPEEPAVEETTPQESSPEEPAVEETTPQESSPEEPAVEETSPQESSPEEPAVEETTPQESSPEEPTVEETSPQESGTVIVLLEPELEEQVIGESISIVSPEEEPPEGHTEAEDAEVPIVPILTGEKSEEAPPAPGEQDSVVLDKEEDVEESAEETATDPVEKTSEDPAPEDPILTVPLEEEEDAPDEDAVQSDPLPKEPEDAASVKPGPPAPAVSEPRLLPAPLEGGVGIRPKPHSDNLKTAAILTEDEPAALVNRGAILGAAFFTLTSFVIIGFVGMTLAKKLR